MSERKEIKNLKRIIETENRYLWFDAVCYAAMNLLDDLDSKIEELQNRDYRDTVAYSKGYNAAKKRFKKQIEELQKELEGKKRGVGYHDVEEFYK